VSKKTNGTPEATEQALRRLQVKAVVIDEAEHLMQTDATHKPVDQLNWLKSLTNHTNVLHILVGPYTLYDFRNLDSQSARRGLDVHFPRYHLEIKDERLEFVGALRFLLERVPLSCDIQALLDQWLVFRMPPWRKWELIRRGQSWGKRDGVGQGFVRKWATCP
jgi:hypothetical protein